jgi:hypothetical protein
VHGSRRTLALVTRALLCGYYVLLVRGSGGAADFLAGVLSAVSDSDSAAGSAAAAALPAAHETDFGGEECTAELETIVRLVSGGAQLTVWGEGSEEELDVHMLECMLGRGPEERSAKLAEGTDWRLAFTVGWDQVGTLARLLRDEQHSDESLRMAMQVAVTSRRMHHVRLLLNAQPSLAHTIDVFELYHSQHPLLLTNATLHAALVSHAAHSSAGDGSLYARLLGPFLSEFVPGIEARLAAQDTDAPNLSDVMLWGVLLGSLELTRGLWKLASQEHGDPIRLALIASQVSTKVASERRHTSGIDRRNYAAAAETLEGWAVGILDQCLSEHEAARVLLRQSPDGWPNSILRISERAKRLCAATLWEKPDYLLKLGERMHASNTPDAVLQIVRAVPVPKSHKRKRK